jgi:hypothetical protein
MLLDSARVFHVKNVLVIRLERERVKRERGRLIFDLERSLVHPHGHILTRESIFSKEPPVPELDRAVLIQTASKVGGIEDVREDLFRVGSSQHTT